MRWYLVGEIWAQLTRYWGMMKQSFLINYELLWLLFFLFFSAVGRENVITILLNRKKSKKFNNINRWYPWNSGYLNYYMRWVLKNNIFFNHTLIFILINNEDSQHWSHFFHLVVGGNLGLCSQSSWWNINTQLLGWGLKF